MVAPRVVMSSMTLRRLCTTSILAASIAAAVLPGCAGAHAVRSASTCQWFAASTGSGRGRGSARSPFHSVQSLVNRLRPGQTGCLGGGVYYVTLRFDHGGRRRAPITLRSAPHTRATLIGHIYIPHGANNVNVTDLTLDGRNDLNLPSPTVDGANDRFVRDDVTNEHTGICFSLGGSGGYGQARNTLIMDDRIYDCGVLPVTNHQHGIYVANSQGARIIDNVIYDNADRGIQLYSNAQHTTIAGNIIDHNGEGILIAGDGGYASSHNLIIGNLITNAVVRADLGSWWQDPNLKGTGNLVVDNCVYGGNALIDRRAGGFAARGNRNMDPRYANPATGDYALPKGSACATALARGVAAADSYAHPGNQ